jgi:RluA family pseudouridine synthase
MFDRAHEIAVRPGLVHRLDCATSGLVVIAKTQQALSVLSRHFHERRVEKKYLAVLANRVAADELTISAPIGRDPAAQPKWNVMEDGRAAETHLRVLERRSDRTLVEFTPLTGRTNQLRIHSKHIGHPIIGDEWYGEAGAKRLCLHAANLNFYHPAGAGWLKFESPMPETMQREWNEF